MSLIEDFRAVIVGDLFEMKSIADVWPSAGTSLRSALPTHAPSAQDVINLGRHLSPVFTAQYEAEELTTEAQQQGALSRGGAFWEGLVVWYLNLCFAGTRAVAIKKKSQMPSHVRDSLTVWLSAIDRLSEPDVLILHLDSPALDAPSVGNPVSGFQNLINANFALTQVINLQCKTNWNDSIQTPMLWNLMYSAARQATGAGAASMNVLGAASITFGSDGHYLQGLGGFRHTFVTVPSNDLAGFTPTSSPVLRGKAFSGGCFWGYPTTPNACRSIAEFFNVNSTMLPALATIGASAASCVAGVPVSEIKFPTFRL